MAKRVTMKDVADIVGVSKVTVSKALRGCEDISDSTREKIKAVAEKLGYVYNAAGKMLRNSLSYSIGIITLERYFGKDDFYIKLYKLLTGDIEKLGYTAIVHLLDDDGEKNLIMPNMLNEKKVDGLIILGQLSRRYLHRICALKIPVVFLDFYYDGFSIDSINTDNFFGSYEMTNFLIKKGHRKIAYVGNPSLTSSVQDRYLGYCKSLLEYKIPICSEWLIRDRDDKNEWADIIFPENMPTAFVCNSDKAAQRLIGILKQKGYRVPDDVSVVGFDDSTHAIKCDPKITTVKVNLSEMAKLSVKIISKKIDDNLKTYGRVLIHGNIIIRDSVKSI